MLGVAGMVLGGTMVMVGLMLLGRTRVFSDRGPW